MTHPFGSYDATVLSAILYTETDYVIATFINIRHLLIQYKGSTSHICVNTVKCVKPSIRLVASVHEPLVKIGVVMHTHGNLTASYLWQPGEFARRMLGERPSPVPPTRELWPPPQQPLSISTLHVAYLQDEPLPRRSATLPAPPCTIPHEHEYTPATNGSHGVYRPRVCTVGTNTDPPPTILTRIRTLVKRKDESANQPVGRLTAVHKETTFEAKEEENPARKALNRIQKAITGAKYKIAPGTEAVESPKIVYDMPKPGDRMQTTFGQEERTCCKIPTRAEFHRRLRAMGGWFKRRPRIPPRRQAQLPRLQITQV